MKSDELPQVMSLESDMVGAEDYKCDEKAPCLCFSLAAGGYISCF